MTVPSTSNNAINALLGGAQWTSVPGVAVTVTYSFMSYTPSDLTSSERQGLTQMTTAQKTATSAALASWSAVANVNFVQVADTGNNTGGQIRFAQNDQASTSAADTSPWTLNGNLDHAYVFINDNSNYNYSGKYLSNYDFTSGSYANMTLVHEIGHALGLKHPGNYNAGGGTTAPPYLPTATDNNDYTVMSYNSGTLTTNSTHNNYTFSNSPALYDILAIQYIYGPNMSYHAGNDTYSFNNSTIPTCVWDAGGTNTFDFSACTGQDYINLNAGTFSQTKPNANNVSIAYGVTIQNAIGGSGGGTIVGNAAGDHLTGGAGHYIFIPGGGTTVIDGTSSGVSDVIQFSGPQSQYRITWSGSSVTVTETGGNQADGTVSATNIAQLQFTDGTVAAVTTKSAAAAVQSPTIGPVAISDSAANVLANLGGLETLAAAGNLTTITLTDSGTPTMTLTAATAAADTLALRAVTGSLNLVEQGSSGNDSFIAHAGTTTITGGGGHDSVLFQGARAGYSLSATNGIVTVADATASRDGTAVASGIQYLTFTDKTIIVATADQANVARLYQAAFDRAPDTGGLNAWLDVYASMIPASVKAAGAMVALAETAIAAGSISIAQGFTGSGEFQAAYSGLDTQGFLTRLYNNVFSRAPDAGGLAAWTTAMNNGYTKEMVLVGFAESSENITKTGGDWLLAV